MFVSYLISPKNKPQNIFSIIYMRKILCAAIAVIAFGCAKCPTPVVTPAVTEPTPAATVVVPEGNVPATAIPNVVPATIDTNKVDTNTVPAAPVPTLVPSVDSIGVVAPVAPKA
jgi:hypothetical protein